MKLPEAEPTSRTGGVFRRIKLSIAPNITLYE